MSSPEAAEQVADKMRILRSELMDLVNASRTPGECHVVYRTIGGLIDELEAVRSVADTKWGHLIMKGGR